MNTTSHSSVRCVSFARSVCVVLVVFFVVHATTARAQPPDAFGVRAQGMAGAFTAVADDASATWWNPAGLAQGAFFNSIVEFGNQEEPSIDTVPAWRNETRAISTAYPALGLSYYRLQISEIQSVASIGSTGGDRQDQRPADVRLRSLVLNQFGATVGQSVGQHFVVAGTVKLLRGSLGVDVRPAGTTNLDAAGDLDGPGETHVDFDAGAMARFGPATLGLMVRNVTETTYGDGDAAVTLTRQARLGFAISSTARCSTCGGVTVAFDADLNDVPTATGDERRAAAGIEGWTHQRAFGARGGVSFSTTGERRPAASGGLSLAVRKGTFIDVAATKGADESRNSWAAGLRVTF